MNTIFEKSSTPIEEPVENKEEHLANLLKNIHGNNFLLFV